MQVQTLRIEVPTISSEWLCELGRTDMPTARFERTIVAWCGSKNGRGANVRAIGHQIPAEKHPPTSNRGNSAHSIVAAANLEQFGPLRETASIPVLYFSY